MAFSNKNPDRSLDSLRNREKRSISLQHGWFTWVRHGFSILCLTASIGIAVLGFKVGMDLMQVPNLNFLENYNPVQTIQIYDRHDKLVVAVDGAENRIVVPFAKMSNWMKLALLAAEDHHFYQHKGVSLVGIFRAVVSNFTHGKVVEGGSTITQQLAKNLFFEGEKRTIDLKLAELIIALSLENRFSKDKILELYLNEVYFGNNAYGIEQAARNYFGKSASQLDQAESAFLAGIIRSPTKGGSLANRNSAMARQREVLQKMLSYGLCSPADYNLAANEWLVFKPAQVENQKMKINRYPYYVSAVIDSLHGKYNAASIEKQGLKVYTNLDTIAQDIAERALAQGLARAPYGINQGALVTIRVADGAVLALVGGVGDYASNQWNCATNPHTAGSSFKPFVYLAGFEKGIIEEYGTVEDTPFVIKDSNGKEYKPKNYDNKFMGGISVAKAFAYSRNIPALRIGQAVGIDSVISVAERAGVTEPLAPELSLSLGCSAVSPLHMANSYATLARGGVYMAPVLVRKVETRTGRLLDYKDYERSTVFDRNVVAQIVDLMQDCVAEGTGQLAKLPDRPVAGKTGTADQGKDLWFVGFTPDMVTAVWGGNKDNKPVGGSATGGTVMTRIWRDFAQSYYKQVPTPIGCFIACNRPPASLGTDKPYEPDKPKVPPVAYSSSSSSSSYSTPRRRVHRQARPIIYKQAPSGAAVVRADRGITEYNWSKR